MAKKNEQKNVMTEGVTERIVAGVKLESVPMPDNWARGKKSKYPLGEMQVGESFEVLGKKELASLRSAIYKYQAGHDGYTYATRASTDETTGKPLERDGLPVYRCWRTPSNG